MSRADLFVDCFGRTDDQALPGLELVRNVDLVAGRALHQRHFGDFVPSLHVGARGCVEEAGSGQRKRAREGQAASGKHGERQLCGG